MPEPHSPLDAPDRRRLPPLLRKAWYGLNQVFRRRIKRHGATPDQFTILRLLREGSSDGLSQRDLCELMSSDPNTMAALLSRMEEQGLVERRPDHRDKRTRRVTATASGKSLFKKLRATALTLQGDILSAIPEERREQFLSDLDAVAEACRQFSDAT
jgi:DNA-binding MarR family transcriptional regulator